MARRAPAAPRPAGEGRGGAGRRRKAWLLALVAAALAVAGWGIADRRHGPLARLGLAPRGPVNLLLVSIDTLRADHVGCYGYAAAQTPVLDGLAARGARFTQATTVTPLTLPAHSALFTGTFPASNGVRDNGGFYLGDDQVTLAEVLRGKGYRTGGFIGAFVLDSRWGISQGFERYFDDFDLSRFEAGAGMDAVQRPGSEVVDRAVEWLGQDRTKPFFAWVHLYEPHTPYEAPEPFRSRFPPTRVGAYDAEIATADALVGRLLDALSAEDRLDRTVIVVLGDHGESLGEHREQTHGFFIYDATLHIPLILAGPSVPARVVADQVRIVDVMPTVLELLGVRSPARVQGRSLVPELGGAHLGLAALSECWYPRYHYGWSELSSLRDGRYKLILAPRRELYDVERDPGETDDLSARAPERVAAMEKALREMAARVANPHAAAGPRSIDPESEERLQALGYVAGSGSARSLEDRPRGDPKDKIGLYNLLKQAGEDSLENRLDDAVAKVEEALAADPEIVEGYTLLGNFHAKAKRWDQAVLAYRRALAIDPEHQGAIFSLAVTYKSMGRLADAEAGLERARALDPRNGRVLWLLAEVWMQQGKLDRAEVLLKEALALKVDEPRFALKLGECYVEMKRYAEAEAALRRSLTLDPHARTAHYNLALVFEARGEVPQAIAEYEAELKLNPEGYRASFNLAKILLKAGRPQDAAAQFRRAVEANAEFAGGYLYLAKALLDAGDLRGAEENAGKGLALHPERELAPLGHYVLADVYNRLGRVRDAAREVAAARRLERGG